MPDKTDLGHGQFDWLPPNAEENQFWVWEFDGEQGCQYRNILLWIGEYRAWHTPGLSGYRNSIEVASDPGARPVRHVSTED